MKPNDYKRIALAIKGSRIKKEPNDACKVFNNGITDATIALADEFEKDDKHFDRERFLRGAGVTPT